MNLTHLGTKYGGWSIPVDLLPENAICYCVGAGEDISFDVKLAEEHGCKVYTFDPTPRSADHVQAIHHAVAQNTPMPINGDPDQVYKISAENLKENFEFHPVGVFDKDVKTRFYAPKNEEHVSHSIVNLQKTDTYFEADCKRLQTIMQELGHDKIDLLKLDIEGAENEVLADMIASDIFPQVLCVEFDRALNGLQRKETLAQIDALIRFGYAIAREDKWNITLVDQQKCSKAASTWRHWRLKWRAARQMRRAARKAAAAA